MVEAPELASERYSVGSARGQRRFLGRDQRLARDVLLWLLPVRTDDERNRGIELAATTARLTHPVFLQTLDLVEEDERLAIVLESPADAEVTGEHPLTGALPALVAATLTLRVGTALEEAAERGLIASALQLTYVHVSGADEVRLDPIGLFERSEAEPSVLVPLLTEFLASFLRERSGAARAFDPGADSAVSFVERWRERAARGNADDLEAFLDELRRIARAPADFYVEEDAGFQRPADAMGIAINPTLSAPADEETTALLPRQEPLRGVPAPRPERPRYDEELTGPLPRRADDPRRPDDPRRGATARRRPPKRTGSSMFVTFVGFGLIAALGVVLVFLGMRWADRTPPNGAAAPEPTVAASTSPTPVPANRAAIMVLAREQSDVRISVDGTVAFTGTLRSNETRSFEGNTRVQVWTTNGKHVDVTVNGFPLGALSAAVGHPEWNTVDWGWDAGWKPR